MKLFEVVPGELFSPLASPNRALYADALDVLYTAYRENLKYARICCILCAQACLFKNRPRCDP